MNHGGTRGRVRGLSDRSFARLRTALDNPPAGEEWLALIDLTYPADFPKDGRVAQRHLHTFLMALHRMCAEQLEYVWVLEFQKRGAPHFHVVINFRVDKEWLSRRWYEIVGSGDERHLWAGTKVSEPRDVGDLKAYFVKKYMRKGEQKQVPKGFRLPGRMWGASRGCGKVEREEELTEDEGETAKRLLRRAAERRGRRQRLRDEIRQGRRVGLTIYGAGEAFMQRVARYARANPARATRGRQTQRRGIS